jgi:hypothetical protein
LRTKEFYKVVQRAARRPDCTTIAGTHIYIHAHIQHVHFSTWCILYMKIKHIMQEYMVYSDRTSISALHKLFLSRTYNHQDQGKLGLLAKLKYHLIVTKDKDAVACPHVRQSMPICQ